MINGSQTGKRQSSYRHNIHVNCWYSGQSGGCSWWCFEYTLATTQNFSVKANWNKLFLPRHQEYSPLAQSKLSSCYHMSQQKKPLIVSELFSRKCRLTTKCIDLECHLFVFFLCIPRITLSFGPSIEFVFLNLYYTEISA